MANVILSVPQKQIGEASYYSDKLHGRKTSSGEKYDKNAFTAAHLEHPFGTMLKVTNLKNKKTTMVRVNDRGPHDKTKKRILDLSRAAAEQIDLIKMGKTMVEIEVITEDAEKKNQVDSNEISEDETESEPKENNPKKVIVDNQSETETSTKKNPSNSEIDPEEKKSDESNIKTEDENLKKEVVDESCENNLANCKKIGYYTTTGQKTICDGYGIRVGSYSNYKSTWTQVRKISRLGFKPVFINIDDVEEKGLLYRIVIGQFNEKKDGKSILSKVKSSGYKDAFIKMCD